MFVKVERKAVEILERILRFFSLCHVLEALRIITVPLFKRKASLEDLHSLLLSALFEVNSTVPLAMQLLGELIKVTSSLSRRKNGTFNRKLNDLLEWKVPAMAKPVNGVCSEDVVINKETNLWARIFTPSQNVGSADESTEPSGKKKRPVVVFYHGGGFGVLCADFCYYDKFCRVLSKTTNAVVVSVNYRLAPEHRFPTAYDDCFEALEWLQSSNSAIHLPSEADVSQCFLVGDSAGGNIVHFMACRAAEKDLSPLQIRGGILLQPFFGSQKRTLAELNLVNIPMICTNATDWHWKAFLPKGSDRDHPACNVFGPNAADISKLSLPPLFLCVSTIDILKDHQDRYASGMQQMGHAIKIKNYRGGIHGFFVFVTDCNVGTKLAKSLLQDVREFIQSHTTHRSNQYVLGST